MYAGALQAFEENLARQLREREAHGLLRSLSLSEGIDFCSNDYLGLAHSAQLSAESAEIIRSQPRSGSTGSRLISGNSQLAEELECVLAEYHGVEGALLFPTGYTANFGLLSSVVHRHDCVLYDEYVHASLRDGISLSRARAFSFRHNCLEDLQKKLTDTSGRKFVIVESLYSMDGDFSPLVELASLCETHGAALIVDEAHSSGILGRRGEGLVSALNLQPRVFARIITFGKALGSHGAAILGSQTLRNFLINFSRPFIFTTALPSESLARILAAYRLLPDLDEPRKRLQENSERFDRLFSPRSQPSSVWSPIKSVRVAGSERAMRSADVLIKQGFLVRAIRAPSVPAGQERLRVCLHSFNHETEIDGLVSCLFDTAVQQ